MRSEVHCCGLMPGRDTIVFEEDCHAEDVFATNHTATFLQLAATPAPSSAAASAA